MMSRSARAGFCLLALLIPLTATADDASARTPVCTAKLTVPIEVQLAAPEGFPTGSRVEVEATLVARAELGPIEITIATEGGIELLGPSVVTFPGLARGGEIPFVVPVTYTSAERSAVRVRASASGWETMASLYTIFHEDRTLTGSGSWLELEIRAIEEEFGRGRMTEEAARAATRQVQALEGSFDQTPHAAPPSANERQGLIQPTAVRPEGAEQPVEPAGGGCITVQGNVSWQDENGSVHPAFGMAAEVWDSDTGFDEFVDSVATDGNGNYSLVVDNDDGIGAGDRDIYVKFVTHNNAISVEPAGIFTSAYEADSDVHDETPCGAVIVENFICANTGTGPSCQINEAGSWIAVHTASNLNGGSFLGQIVIEWPGTGSSSNYDDDDINLLELDRFDWDVIHHEYGHYIMDSFDMEDSPGGPHDIGDCVSDEHDSKSEGVRLAWAEGWPTYNGTQAQQVLGLAGLNVPRVGDVRYTDTEDSTLDYSLEAQSFQGRGEDNELAVQRILWDLFDGPADGLDNVTVPILSLFDPIDAANAETLSEAWSALRATLSDADQLLFGAVARDHDVGPSVSSPTAGTLVSPSNATFFWDRRVGCSSTYAGNDFTLRFFDTASKAPIVSIPVGNTVSATLTQTQFDSVAAMGHDVTWAVEGENTSSPATGPYLGDSFAITVNRPPVADAGTDIVAECTSPTTTPVQLDGTGSSDPDGDTLTYGWSASGVTLVPPNSPMPTGDFPIGITVATLEVSDGYEEDTDDVQVSVVDTTPPTIACPGSVVVECSSHCLNGGVPSDDPQLTPFFAGVSAIDTCDTTPTITDDRPACFPLGDTDVTFTACDDYLNCSSCVATVTVVDTTPPEISVDLNRDVLWPPNHTLASIVATVIVTDACDPNPTFVLTSITSNEPDEGLGDGDAPKDIDGATYGTADTEFLLRSERAGLLDGRVYTIVYTASDQSGNTGETSVEVRVPHDRSGGAHASTGYNSAGTGFVRNATTFRLVVLGRADLDTRSIDPHNAYVGNTRGADRPRSHRRLDLNRDGFIDLELTYDVQKTIRLRMLSGSGEPVGLHYRTGDGNDYLVPNIFALGPPVVFETAPNIGWRD